MEDYKEACGPELVKGALAMFLVKDLPTVDESVSHETPNSQTRFAQGDFPTHPEADRAL